MPRALRPTLLAMLDVSAASGLVACAQRLFVVADDELFLASYTRAGRPRERLRLVRGELPVKPKARKRRKPDFEALALLPDGSLLALGSGSSARRRVGVRIARDRTGRATRARAVDLEPLYVALEAELGRVNVEGACVVGDALVLLQRGGKQSTGNTVIRLDLARTAAALAARRPLARDSLRALTHVELGEIDGVPLSFTDATPHPRGGILFSAAAEDTNDPVIDGPCAGSALGWLGRDGRLRARWSLSKCGKVEGLALARRASANGALSLFLVTDEDDRAVPSQLLRVELPAPR